MRYLVCGILLLSAVLSAGQDCSPASDPPPDAPTVLYTARLLGYVWHERPGTGEEATRLLYNNLKCSRTLYPNSILLGMGDNFAPQYESRFLPNGQPKPRLGPFDFDSDPVAKAFPYLQYDVMVPGPEDFYFGAEYLRLLGNHWNAKSRTAAPKLLASNLVIQTTRDPPRKYPDKEQNYITQRDDVSVALPDAVLPWMQTVTVSTKTGKTDTPPVWKAHLCPAIFSPVDIESSDSECAYLPTPPGEPSEDGKTYRFQLPGPSNTLHLEVGKAYGFCIDGLPPVPNKKSGDKRLCAPFQVSRPFFADPQPWMEKDVNGVRFVIFGVVDDELRGQLSLENAAWCDKDCQHSESPAFFPWLDKGHQHSEIAVVAPDIALSQAVEAYTAYAASRPAPAIVVRVLMAQMAPAKAEQLAANLTTQSKGNAPPLIKFDLVLSAADERRSTGRENREIKPLTFAIAAPAAVDPSVSAVAELLSATTLSAPLIIPHPIYRRNSSPNLIEPLEAVFVIPSPSGKRCFNEPSGERCVNEPSAMRYVNEPYMPPAANHLVEFNALCPKTPELEKGLVDFLKQNGLESQDECPGLNKVECFTLHSMRKQFDADAAMLQRWDFFDACIYRPDGVNPPINPPIAPSDLLPALQRTVWAASYLTRVSITGAKLKSVLDTSQKIAKAQKASTYTSALHDRELVYIGIAKKDKTYYVNSQPIDDNRMYSIATDDALAVGSTQYPDLIDTSDTSFAKPEVFNKGKGYYTLSPVCEAFQSLYGPANQGKIACPHDVEKSGIMAVADSSWPVHDGRNALGPWDQLSDYVASLFPSESPLPTQKAEKAVQNHRILSVTLQNLAGSFIFSKPNLSDSQVEEVFGGVTNTNVIQAHTELYSMQDALRINWSGAQFNLGVDQETGFGRSRQGSLTGSPDSVTLTSNLFLVSPFIEYNLHRWTPHWKLVLRPIDYLSDLAGTQLTLDSSTPSTQFKVNLPPRNNLQTRAGVRFERDTTGTSFFEFGYIHRDARNVLSVLTFNPGTPSQFVCPLNVPQSAGECASTQTLVIKNATPTTASFAQNGFYWNSIFTIPVMKKMKYVFGTDGNLFTSRPGQDVTPLTKYAVIIDNSIQFAFWGNLAFAPHYGIFLFEDQVQHATLTRTIADVQLTYYFNWHDGLHWSDVLRGKTTQPAPGTAGVAAAGVGAVSGSANAKAALNPSVVK